MHTCICILYQMEKDEFYTPRVADPHAASHAVRKFPSGKADFQHHPTMIHASRVSEPFELPTSEVRPGGSSTLTSSHLGKHSTVLICWSQITRHGLFLQQATT